MGAWSDMPVEHTSVADAVAAYVNSFNNATASPPVIDSVLAGVLSKMQVRLEKYNHRLIA